MGDDVSARGVLQRLVARLDMDVLVSRLIAGFRDIPGYRRFMDDEAWIRELARWNLDTAARWFAEGRRLGEGEVEVLREVVRRRASEGMGEELLKPYRLGVRLVWKTLLETADDRERMALAEAAELFFEYGDLLAGILTEAYSDERQTAVSEDERRARALLESVCADIALTPEDRQLADRLGFQLLPAYRPFVATLAGPQARRHVELAGRLRAEGARAASEGTRVVGLLQEPIRFEALGLGADLLVAEGGALVRKELAAALDDLRALIAIAGRAGRSGSVTLDEFLPELLLARSPHLADRIEERVFSALREGEHEELIRTLEILVDQEFDRGATAAALPVHRNTLAYRLGRIEELTGLQLDHAADRALVWLAVLRRRAVRDDEWSGSISVLHTWAAAQLRASIGSR